MSTSRLADTLIAAIESGITAGRRDVIVREISRLEGAVRSQGASVGGRVTEIHTSNAIISYTEGIELLNGRNQPTVHLLPSGNAQFGANLNDPGSTSFSVFAVDTEHNEESFSAGSVLFGDNSAARANLVWDPDSGRLNFRGGTTVNAYIDTDGTLHATSAVLSGAITATSGLISGLLTVGSVAPTINIDGSAKTIGSSNYSAGLIGWQVNSAGSAEFNSIRARGEIVTAVFKYNEIFATAGTLGAYPQAGTLYSAVTMPAASGTWVTINVRNTEAGVSTLTAGQLLYMKAWDGTGVRERWFFIRTGANESIVNNGAYTAYGCQTILTAAGAYTFQAGQAVIGFGTASGGGIVALSADGAYGTAPNLTIATHSGTPWLGLTTVARVGNLAGITDATFGALSGYGIYTTNGYFTGKVNAVDGYFAGTITANAGSIAGALTIGSSGGIYQGTGTFASPTTGLKIWNTSGVGRIAGYNGGTAQWYAGTDGKLYAGGGTVLLDSDGIAIDIPSALDDNQSYALRSPDGTRSIVLTGTEGASTITAYLSLYHYASKDGYIFIGSAGGETKTSKVSLGATAGTNSINFDVIYDTSGGRAVLTGGYLSTASDTRVGGGLYVGATNVDPGAGTITATATITAGTNLISTADTLIGGGLSVGNTGVNPATGAIVSTGAITAGTNLAATADVLAGGGITVGATNVDPATGVLSWHGNISNPGAVTDRGRSYHNNTNGLVIYGAGSTYDVLLANKSGAAVVGILTGTTTLACTGEIRSAVSFGFGVSQFSGSDRRIGFYNSGTNHGQLYAYDADNNLDIFLNTGGESRFANALKVEGAFGANGVTPATKVGAQTDLPTNYTAGYTDYAAQNSCNSRVNALLAMARSFGFMTT